MGQLHVQCNTLLINVSSPLSLSLSLSPSLSPSLPPSRPPSLPPSLPPARPPSLPLSLSLSLLLQELPGELNMHSIVREMRKQRPAMVQAKDQYVFVYYAVAEIIGRLLGHTPQAPPKKLNFEKVKKINFTVVLVEFCVLCESRFTRPCCQLWQDQSAHFVILIIRKIVAYWFWTHLVNRLILTKTQRHFAQFLMHDFWNVQWSPV